MVPHPENEPDPMAVPDETMGMPIPAGHTVPLPTTVALPLP
jgi:hypothetical protein